MKLTAALKSWAIANTDVEADADDDSIKQAVADAMLEDSLTGEKYLELSKTEDDVAASEFQKSIQSLTKTVGDLQNVLIEGSTDEGSMSAEKLFSGRSGTIRVKGADEQYSTKSYVAKNRFGQEVYNPAHKCPVRTMSEMEKASIGVLFKKLYQRSGAGNVGLSEHEQKLLDDMTMKGHWAGSVNGEYSAEITGGRGIKSLIDDSLSGGIEINPIWFDEAVISYPLLSGELYPHVEEIQVARGRRIEGASIATPTANWGAYDGQAIDLFNTSSMVDAIDSTIHEITCAVPVGRNLMADSPIDIGATITRLIGERFKQELDRVVGKGTGGTEPSGLFSTIGVTALATANATAGPPTLSDYMSLLFAIPKQYRSPSYGPAFVMNDTQYARSRAIKIDPQNPSGDQRSVFSPLMEGSGAAVNSYSMLGWPVRICNDLANSQVGMFCMRRYRMYRRLAMSLQIVQDGATLARSNEVLIIARARFGGQFYDLNAGVKFANPQS